MVAGAVTRFGLAQPLAVFHWPAATTEAFNQPVKMRHHEPIACVVGLPQPPKEETHEAFFFRLIIKSSTSTSSSFFDVRFQTSTKPQQTQDAGRWMRRIRWAWEIKKGGYAAVVQPAEPQFDDKPSASIRPPTISSHPFFVHYFPGIRPT